MGSLRFRQSSRAQVRSGQVRLQPRRSRYPSAVVVAVRSALGRPDTRPRSLKFVLTRTDA
jgi:hypothetical protein